MVYFLKRIIIMLNLDLNKYLWEYFKNLHFELSFIRSIQNLIQIQKKLKTPLIRTVSHKTDAFEIN